MRKAPRIISRRKRAPQLKKQDSDLPAKEVLSRDIDDEIGEDVIVQGGVMMRIVDENEVQDDIHEVEPINSFQQFSRHITVEAPSLPYQNGPYKENPLPGTADEVESYPCSFCSDKPYLTDRGLLKHTESCHPEHLDQVLQEIAKIREEWERRYIERSRQRERVAIAKMRQDAISDAIANIAAGTSVEAIFDEYSEQDEECATERCFEPCQICGILVNALHPSAMANHMRAHTKNDELRNQLIQTYGPEFVMRLTCHDCQLVFSDKRKLNAHIENSHSRKRKYVCKWCGTVCLSMSDLNTHKADVHGMPVSRSKQVQNSVATRLQIADRSNYALGLKSNDTTRKASYPAQNEASTSSPKITPILEDTPCKTTCELCGLLMVKPSLLVRHMLRVHSRRSFTATIEIKGMPCIKVDVDGGKLTWWCCDLSFSNRFDFLYHRRSCHQPKFEFSSCSAGVVDTQVVSSCDRVDDVGQRMIEDEQIVQINEAAGSSETSENLYVLLVTDPSEDDGKDGTTWGLMPMDGEVTSNVQQITLTAEQYEQLRMQADGNLNNMQVMLMSEVVTSDETESADRLSCGTPPPYISTDSLDSSVPVVDIEDGGPPTLQIQQVQTHTIPGISVIGHDDSSQGS